MSIKSAEALNPAFMYEFVVHEGTWRANVNENNMWGKDVSRDVLQNDSSFNTYRICCL